LKPNSRPGDRTMPNSPIAIALSARWNTFPQRFHWIAEHGFDLEYTPDPEDLAKLPGHVDPILARGVSVRYHGFFPGCELGHSDSGLAEKALDLHKRTLETLEGHGEPVITVHVGLDPDVEIEPRRVLENLSRLVEYGLGLGITVCLENLRRGPSSNPDTLLAWASESGARITFDAGHAVSSRIATSGAYSALEFLDLVADHVWEAHLYGTEQDRHYPIRSTEDCRPIVERLTKTACRWWTIELDDYREALQTREILRYCL
jgi:sugar phosphate isomerase/epimerase